MSVLGIGSRLEAAGMHETISREALKRALDFEGLQTAVIDSMAAVLKPKDLELDADEFLKVVEKIGKRQIAIALKEHLESVPRLAIIAAGVVRSKHLHDIATEEFFAGRDR